MLSDLSPVRRSLDLWAATRPGWDAQEAARLMDRFEVPLRTRPSRMSLGQRSALDAVLALACHCPVLLLDELFAPAVKFTAVLVKKQRIGQKLVKIRARLG